MKKSFIYLAIWTVFLIGLVIFQPVFTQAAEIKNPLSSQNFCQLLTGISNAVAGLVGVISVIMLIISGILFVTSGGSPEKVNAAKTAFKYAIIGIIIALASKAIIDTLKYILGYAISPGEGGC